MSNFETSSTIKKMVDSQIFILLARGAMIAATCIGLPVAGWMMNRGIETIDKMDLKMEALRDQAGNMSSTIRLIQQQMTDRSVARDRQLDGMSTRIEDHEGRLRILERPDIRRN